MSKSIISIVLRLIAFALAVLPKAVNSILALIDLVDDGCINNSVTRPEWVSDLLEIVDQINSVGSSLVQIQSKVRETPTVD